MNEAAPSMDEAAKAVTKLCHRTALDAWEHAATLLEKAADTTTHPVNRKGLHIGARLLRDLAKRAEGSMVIEIAPKAEKLGSVLPMTGPSFLCHFPGCLKAFNSAQGLNQHTAKAHAE